MPTFKKIVSCPPPPPPLPSQKDLQEAVIKPMQTTLQRSTSSPIKSTIQAHSSSTDMMSELRKKFEERKQAQASKASASHLPPLLVESNQPDRALELLRKERKPLPELPPHASVNPPPKTPMKPITRAQSPSKNYISQFSITLTKNEEDPTGDREPTTANSEKSIGSLIIKPEKLMECGPSENIQEMASLRPGLSKIIQETASLLGGLSKNIQEMASLAGPYSSTAWVSNHASSSTSSSIQPSICPS